MQIRKQKKLLLGGLALLVLSGCQEGDPNAPDVSTALFGAECDASAFATLIGKPAAAAQGIVHDGPIQVLGPTDPMTRDFNPGRLSIFLDAERQTITNVACG